MNRFISVVICAAAFLSSLPVFTNEALASPLTVRCWYTSPEQSKFSLDIKYESLDELASASLQFKEACESLQRRDGYVFSHLELNPHATPAAQYKNKIVGAVVVTAVAVATWFAYRILTAPAQEGFTPVVGEREDFAVEGAAHIKGKTRVRGNGDCGFYCLWAAKVDSTQGHGAAARTARLNPEAPEKWIAALKSEKIVPAVADAIAEHKDQFITDINNDLRAMRQPVAASVEAPDCWAEYRNNPALLTPDIAAAIRESDLMLAEQKLREERDRQRFAYASAHPDLSPEASNAEILQMYRDVVLNRQYSKSTLDSVGAQAAANALGRPIDIYDTYLKAWTSFLPAQGSSSPAIPLYLQAGHYSLLHTN